MYVQYGNIVLMAVRVGEPRGDATNGLASCGRALFGQNRGRVLLECLPSVVDGRVVPYWV